MRVWLRGLPEDVRYTIGANLFVIQNGWPVGGPLVAGLGDGLWEMRSTRDRVEYRLLFTVTAGSVWVLHGFTKKTQQTPHGDLEIARKRLAVVRAFLDQSNR